ncbi:uncharacterized protein DEA37_0001836 [Paragonimus westermani]|uniref:CABIT domain-containing protein n=1 Tax=Paragonimus westermani TaxID=34504 RepID=A0A5J4NSI3_9TREM|nr:uncharacterized protein DEA37_0001836 [Paragonimus westermani]
MAFVSTPPQLQHHMLWNHLPPTSKRLSCSSQGQSEQKLWDVCDEYATEIALLPSRIKYGGLAQSAIQLNCYDNLPKRVLIGSMGTPVTPHLTYPDTTPVGRMTKQLCTYPSELTQHQSLIDLKTSQQVNAIGASNNCLPGSSSTFEWVRNNSSSLKISHSSNHSASSAFVRFTIQDLIQQECYMSPVSYLLDQPSRLVRVECRKPGCRCVLKYELALALKIVSNVSLVRGNWIRPKSQTNIIQRGHRMISNRFTHSHPTLQDSLAITHPHASLSHTEGPSSVVHTKSSPIILTTCSPTWFEVVDKSNNGPADISSPNCVEVPVWSSGKALWRAKPNYFLLRKSTQCMFAYVNQPITMSSTDVFKQDHSILNIDGHRTVSLRPGTVLQLINCRLCRLVSHHDTLNTLHSPFGIVGRHRTKTVSMLQCAVVGDKVLCSVAAAASDLSPHDAIRWFADGPRLVYIPLDTKTMVCSPVAEKLAFSETAASRLSGHVAKNTGLHSLISLLSQYRLPVIVRPISGLRPNEWCFVKNMECMQTETRPKEQECSMKSSLVRLDGCYHGDLIFLEPISDCRLDCIINQCQKPNLNRDGQAVNPNSRFFVVTPDMLSQHNFFVANSFCAAQHTRELEVHATRVSHFLAACHPSEGLIYLLKRLEDITLSSTTGPSYIPLTRTLGPVGISIKHATVYSAIASLTAAAAIATQDHGDYTKCPSYSREIQSDNLPTTGSGFGTLSPLSCDDHYQSSSCLMGLKTYTHSSLSSSLQASEADQMNALCDEIEDIYYYVRNGRFPAQSHSMTSLIHHITSPSRLDQLKYGSAPISPQLCDHVYDHTGENPAQKQLKKTDEHICGNVLKLSSIQAEQTKHSSPVPAPQKQDALVKKHHTPLFENVTGLKQFQTSTQKQHTQDSELNNDKFHVNKDKCANVGHGMLNAAAISTKKVVNNLHETSTEVANLPVMTAQQLPAYYGTEHGRKGQKWYTNKKILKMSTTMDSQTRTCGNLIDLSQIMNDSHDNAQGAVVMKPQVRHKDSSGMSISTLVSPKKSSKTSKVLAVSGNKEDYSISRYSSKQYFATPFSSNSLTVSVSSGSNVMVRSMNWHSNHSNSQGHHKQIPSALMVHPLQTIQTSCTSARLSTSPIHIVRLEQSPKQTWLNTADGLDHIRAQQVRDSVGDPPQNANSAKISAEYHKQASHLSSVQKANQSRADESHPHAVDTSVNRHYCACQSNFSNSSLRPAAWRHCGGNLKVASNVLDNKHMSPHHALRKVYSKENEKHNGLKKEQTGSPYHNSYLNTLPQIRHGLITPSPENEVAVDPNSNDVITPRKDLRVMSHSSGMLTAVNYAPVPIQSDQTFKPYYAEQLKPPQYIFSSNWAS